MKKLLLIVIITTTSLASYSQGSWTQKMSVGVNARCSSAGMATSTKGYVACGFLTAVDHLKDMWEYDPVGNTWTQKADFPGTKRRWLIGFAINDKCYVGLGAYMAGISSYIYYTDFYEFDPTTGNWTTKASFPGTPRASAFSFVLNGVGYVGGGEGASGVLSDMWAYDPLSDTWTQKNNLGCGPRMACASFTIDNFGYIGTGCSSTAIYHTDLWRYNPVTDNWIQKMSFPGTSRWYATGFSVGKVGFIGTGNHDATYFKDFWQYDPSTNSWTSIPDLPASVRAVDMSFTIGNKGYVGTGETSGTSDAYDFWEYTPSGNGIENYESNTEVCIYPNPVVDYLQISNKKTGEYRYEVYSTSMQKLQEAKFEKETRINFMEYPEGLYIVVVYDSKNKTLERIKIVR